MERLLIFLGLVFMGACIVGAGQRISSALLALVGLLERLAKRREEDVTDESHRW